MQLKDLRARNETRSLNLCSGPWPVSKTLGLFRCPVMASVLPLSLGDFIGGCWSTSQKRYPAKFDLNYTVSVC